MNTRTRFAALFTAVLGLAACAMPQAANMPGVVKIDMPTETAKFQQGPGWDVAARSCMVCHSVDYIYMQPPLTKTQWHAEVMKMKKVYGAPFPESDVDTIVNYLMTQNGKH